MGCQKILFYIFDLAFHVKSLRIRTRMFTCIRTPCITTVDNLDISVLVQKTNLLTFLGCKQLLFVLTIFPAVEKTLSAEEEVAGMFK